MVKATILLDVKKMPPEGLTLCELKEFFDRTDRYHIADYFSNIKCFLNYKGRDQLSYSLVSENGQDKLIFEFAEEEGFEFFKMMAPRCVFCEVIKSEN